MIELLISPSLPEPYTVSQLNRAVRQLLGDEFVNIRVAGEISNLSTPSSGHIYFTLKDADAQIRCAMFRTRLGHLAFKPVNGLQVIVRAQVSLYEPRGDYQLIVDEIEVAGAGLLRQRFEQLKQKLAAEGLFDSAKKQAIPLLPRVIGVITSPSGAAIRDILSVLKRRFPAIPVIIYPTAVQREQAKTEIVQAIKLANQRAECDVIILSRGGGSLEDLWAFNEEMVARAIFNSRIPLIAGIGHEIDFSIADFVADLRAATPSAAAEHAVPDQQAWLQRLASVATRFQQLMHHRLKQLQQHLVWAEQRLQQQHPGRRLLQQAQTLDQLEARLQQAVQNRLQHAQSLLNTYVARLGQHSPAEKIRRYQAQQLYLSNRLQAAIEKTLQHFQQQLNRNSQTLHAVSPLATLERGYAIVSPLNSARIIHQSQQLQSGDLIQTRFAKGKIISQVKDIYL
ncbi:MAG: exodeoxyribonuclease VII large subunit [Methylococcaceae bacterium]|nr:exodeoxyribonuclease VII large subunit [Methylococcaceae bacterium]